MLQSVDPQPTGVLPDAITITNGGATVDLTRCIGCGLCVSTCPTEAIHLKKKESSQVVIPPASSLDLYRKIATERETARH